MIAVDEALARVIAGFSPLPAEQVSLSQALGRVLAEDVAARLTQPPVDVSAMDGYALRSADLAAVPVVLTRIGVSAAGEGFAGAVEAGQCVRIYTGAPVPAGADTIVIQEDTQAENERITVLSPAAPGRHIRKAGMDFAAGTVGLRAGKRLGARDVALAAAMNVPWLKVIRRPRVAILATGDELAMPGDSLAPGQIASSNGPGMAAAIQALGGEAVDLGIARDERGQLAAMAAGARGSDLLLTLGGASVGDRDLVKSVLGEAGMTLDFWKVAMRPGKPLIFGRIGDTPLLGLPGNPVSAFVCAALFLRAALCTMQGQPALPQPRWVLLGRDLPPCDGRQTYLRAVLAPGSDGDVVATPLPLQDSAALSELAQADGLIVRPPGAAAAKAGEKVPVLPLAEGI